MSKKVKQLTREPVLRLWQVELSAQRYESAGYRTNLIWNVGAFNILTAIRHTLDEVVATERWEDILVLSATHKGTIDLVVSEE